MFISEHAIYLLRFIINAGVPDFTPTVEYAIMLDDALARRAQLEQSMKSAMIDFSDELHHYCSPFRIDQETEDGQPMPWFLPSVDKVKFVHKYKELAEPSSGPSDASCVDQTTTKEDGMDKVEEENDGNIAEFQSGSVKRSPHLFNHELSHADEYCWVLVLPNEADPKYDYDEAMAATDAGWHSIAGSYLCEVSVTGSGRRVPS